MIGANFLGIRPAPATACASAASKCSMWRKVDVSEKASAVAAAEPSAFTRRPAMGSDVEEDGLFGTAEMGQQAPHALPVALGDQGGAARGIDAFQHRILVVGRIAVEIEPGCHSVEQATGEDRDVDVRRLHAALRPRYAAGLHGAERGGAVGEGGSAAIALETGIERQVAPVVGVVIAAVAVGL